MGVAYGVYYTVIISYDWYFYNRTSKVTSGRNEDVIYEVKDIFHHEITPQKVEYSPLIVEKKEILSHSTVENRLNVKDDSSSIKEVLDMACKNFSTMSADIFK